MADNRRFFYKGDKIAAQNRELELSSVETGVKVPQAIDIEESVLASMMLDPESVIDMMSVLSDDYFYKPEHRLIFSAIKSLNKVNSPIDMITVADQLKKDGNLDAIGGTAFLSTITSNIGVAAHTDYYVKILIDKYIQRQMIHISYDALKKSYDDAEPVDDVLNSVQQKLFDLSEKNMTNRERKIGDIIKEKLDIMEKVQNDPSAMDGIRSGYEALDRITSGWHSSNLIIVAGRPGMGKTAFVVTMARNMAVNFKTPVAFFSLEQSSLELVERLLLAESGISAKKIKGSDRHMSDADWQQLNDRIAELMEAPIYIDETPSLSIADFRAKARRLVNGGVKVLIVDYLQLMTGSKELRGNREQEVAEISRSLKAVAKELGVPVIALAQLNRAAADSGKDGITRRPQLTQLRESGAIEQDADIVLFVHRSEYYLSSDSPKIPGLSEIVIAKHRNGESNTSVYLKYIAEQMRFVDLTLEEERLISPTGSPFSQQIQSRMNGMENVDIHSNGGYVSISQMGGSDLNFDLKSSFNPTEEEEDYIHEP